MLHDTRADSTGQADAAACTLLNHRRGIPSHDRGARDIAPAADGAGPCPRAEARLAVHRDTTSVLSMWRDRHRTHGG